MPGRRTARPSTHRRSRRRRRGRASRARPSPAARATRRAPSPRCARARAYAWCSCVSVRVLYVLVRVRVRVLVRARMCTHAPHAPTCMRTRARTRVPRPPASRVPAYVDHLAHASSPCAIPRRRVGSLPHRALSLAPGGERSDRGPVARDRGPDQDQAGDQGGHQARCGRGGRPAHACDGTASGLEGRRQLSAAPANAERRPRAAPGRGRRSAVCRYRLSACFERAPPVRRDR